MTTLEELSAMLDAMTPGRLHLRTRANALGTWTVFIGSGEYASNQLCAIDRREDAECIVALRNYAAEILRRLRIAGEALGRLKECKCGKPGCVYFDAASVRAELMKPLEG